MSRWYCKYTTALGIDFGNALDTAGCGIDTVASGQKDMALGSHYPPTEESWPREKALKLKWWISVSETE